MSINIAAAIDALIGGFIFTIYGYFTSCYVALRSPVRGSLALWAATRSKTPDRLASYSVLFLSSLLVSTASARYSSFVQEAARAVAETRRFTDISLFAVTIVAILIFVFVDLVIRLWSYLDARRSAARFDRLVAVRRFQASGLLAVVALTSSAMSVALPLVRPHLAEQGVLAWIMRWNHVWLVQFVLFIVFVACIFRWRSVITAGRKIRLLTLKCIAPALICAFILLYRQSDGPGAYILRRPDFWISATLRDSVSDEYPAAAHVLCTLQLPDRLTVTAILSNSGKYTTAVDLRSAVIVFAQGALPGHFDTDVAYFKSSPEPDEASSNVSRFVILKPGDATTVSLTLGDSTQVEKGKVLVERWTKAANAEEYAYAAYFLQPSCYLGLQMINVDTHGGRLVPSLYRKDDLWAELAKTVSGNIVVVSAANKTPANTR